MLYLVALLLPPLAILLSGKIFQALINIPLCLLFYVPGVIHAILVVKNHYDDKRHKELVRAVRSR